MFHLQELAVRPHYPEAEGSSRWLRLGPIDLSLLPVATTLFRPPIFEVFEPRLFIRSIEA